jgi:drug/metabolite transporter (DMT)-like permease
MNAREWGMLLLLGLLWGSTFYFTAIGLTGLPPLTLVTLRILLAAIAMHAVVAFMGLRLPTDRRAWIEFVRMSVLNNVIPFILIAWGQTRVASGVASVLIATTPMLTALCAHVLTHDEKITRNGAIGIVCGIVGVAVMIGGAVVSQATHDFAGEIAILGAAVAYALSSIQARRFSALNITPLVSTTGLLTVSVIILMPAMIVFDRPWTLPWPGAQVVVSVLILALVASAFAYLLYFRIAATAGATNLMLVTFLMPVVAILLGVFVLGERLEPRHIWGMALIAVGLSAIDGRLWRWMRRRNAVPAE